jgi:hypothetical protein
MRGALDQAAEMIKLCERGTATKVGTVKNNRLKLLARVSPSCNGTRREHA